MFVSFARGFSANGLAFMFKHSIYMQISLSVFNQLDPEKSRSKIGSSLEHQIREFELAFLTLHPHLPLILFEEASSNSRIWCSGEGASNFATTRGWRT